MKNAHMNIIDMLKKTNMFRKDPKKTARFDPMAAADEALNQKVILAYHCGILKTAPDTCDFQGHLPASQVLVEMNEELSEKISKLSDDDLKIFNTADAALESDAKKFFQKHKSDHRVIDHHSLSGTLCDLFNSVMLTTTSTSTAMGSAFEQDRHDAFFANVLQTKRNEHLYTLTSKNLHSLVSAVSAIENVSDVEQFTDQQRLLSEDDLSKLLSDLLQSFMAADDKIAELIPRDQFDLMYPPRDKAIAQVDLLKAVKPENTTTFLKTTQNDPDIVRWGTGRYFEICENLGDEGAPELGNDSVYNGPIRVEPFGKMSYWATRMLNQPNSSIDAEQAKAYYQWMKPQYQSGEGGDLYWSSELVAYLTAGKLPANTALETRLQEQKKDIKHDERVTKAFDEMVVAVDSFQLHMEAVEKYCIRASTLELAPSLDFTNAANAAAALASVEELALAKVVELTGKIQEPASKLLKWLQTFEAPRQAVCEKITAPFQPNNMQDGLFSKEMATKLNALRKGKAYIMKDKLSAAKNATDAVDCTYTLDSDGVITNAIVGHVAHGMAAICRNYPNLFFTEPELAPVIGMQLMLHALSMKVQKNRATNGLDLLPGIGVWKHLPGSEKYISETSYHEIENRLEDIGDWVDTSGYAEDCANRDYYSPICEDPFGEPHLVTWDSRDFYNFPYTHTKAFVPIERHRGQYHYDERTRIGKDFQDQGHTWYNEVYKSNFMHIAREQEMTDDQEYKAADFGFIDECLLPFSKHLMDHNGTN